LHWDIRVGEKKTVRVKEKRISQSHWGRAPLGWIELLRKWKVKFSLGHKQRTWSKDRRQTLYLLPV
jgi:hypothetical protein